MRFDRYIFYFLLLVLPLNAQEVSMRMQYRYVKTDECIIPIPARMTEINPGIYAIQEPRNDIEKSQRLFIGPITNIARDRDLIRGMIAKSKMKKIYHKHGYAVYLSPKLSPVIDIEGNIIGGLSDFLLTTSKTLFDGFLNQDEAYFKHLLDYCYAHRINPPQKDNTNRENNNSF